MQEDKKNIIHNNDLPLDVYSIIRALLKDWWMIITAGIVGMLLAYLASGIRYAPMYTSSMTFIVSSLAFLVLLFAKADTENKSKKSAGVVPLCPYACRRNGYNGICSFHLE